MTLITKSDILKGSKKIVKRNIPAMDGELWLRPLTSSELDELNYIEAEGMGNFEQNSRSKSSNLSNANLTQTNKINVLKVTKASDKAKYEKIRLSLDNEKYSDDPWETEDIQQFSRPAINQLIDIIDEISGVNVTKHDIKQFPEN